MAAPASPAALAAVAFVCVAAGVGCARHGVEVTAAAAEKLTSAATAYVAVPEDGRFGTKVYAGSGQEVATLVASALSARLRRVEVADDERSTRANLAQARAGGFTYLIRPSILRWEDQPTAWSGGADQAEVLIEVIDAASGDVADVAVITAVGGAATLSVGAETPAAGLGMPLPGYCERLLPLQAAAKGVEQ